MTATAADATRAPSRQLATASCVALGVCLLAGSASAQGQPLELTLEEAVERAWAQNGASRAADEQASLRRQTQLTRVAALAPDLSVSSSATRTFGRSFSQQEGGIIRGSNDLAGGSVDAELELFSGLSDVAAILRSRQQSVAADRWRARTRQEIALAVTRRYVALLSGRTLVDVRERQLAAQDELLGLVERLVALGRRPETDVYEQLASRAEAVLARVDAEQAVRRAEIALRQLLQVPQEQGVHFTDIPPPGGAALSVDVQQLATAASTERDDVRALEAEVSAAQHGVLGAQSGFWPRLSLRAGYGTNWSSQDLKAIPGTGASPRTIMVTPDDGSSPATLTVPGTGSDPMYNQTPVVEQLLSRHGGSVGLVLTFPIFEGLSTWQRLQEARTDLELAEIALEQRRHAVAAEVEQAALDCQAAEQRVVATRARLQAAEAARDGARRRYELGRGTLLEVTQAQTRFAEAEAAHVRARYELLLAERSLGYRVGDGAEAVATTSGEGP